MDTDTATTPQDNSAMFRTSASLGFAMANGAFLFSLVALYLNRGAGVWEVTTLGQVWMGVASLCLVASRYFWSRKVAPELPPVHPGRTEWRSNASALNTGLILVWAPLELAALFGLILYQLSESYVGLVGGLGFVFFGVFLTRPRRHWFT